MSLKRSHWESGNQGCARLWPDSQHILGFVTEHCKISRKTRIKANRENRLFFGKSVLETVCEWNSSQTLKEKNRKDVLQLLTLGHTVPEFRLDSCSPVNKFRANQSKSQLSSSPGIIGVQTPVLGSARGCGTIPSQGRWTNNYLWVPQLQMMLCKSMISMWIFMFQFI